MSNHVCFTLSFVRFQRNARYKKLVIIIIILKKKLFNRLQELFKLYLNNVNKLLFKYEKYFLIRRNSMIWNLNSNS
ncbi:hypothetical protein Hanom_Chr16g01493261 [Helianthus anomalus]